MPDEEKLNRDKLLLKIMIHAYDEDERRNALVDTKIAKSFPLKQGL